MEGRAKGALDSVIGPEGLRAVTEFDLLERALAGMTAGKRSVGRRVPVLGEDDVTEERRDLVDRRDDGIAVGNGELATGTEVVLHIDDEKDVLRSDLHKCRTTYPVLFVAYRRRFVPLNRGFVWMDGDLPGMRKIKALLLSRANLLQPR